MSRDGSFDVINGRYLQLYPEPTATPTPVVVEYRALDSNTILPAFRNLHDIVDILCSQWEE